MKYDRQALAMRRLQCENLESDPIVWTNQKFIRWAHSIDLGEYADHLKGKQPFAGDPFRYQFNFHLFRLKNYICR